jgi:hypothetical protein
VVAEQHALRERGVFSTYAARAAAPAGGVAGAVFDYSHAALQRSRELSNTFAAAVQPRAFHSAADGFAALQQFFASSSLVGVGLRHAVLCAGDHWATLFATASQQAAQRLISAGDARQRGFDTVALQCIRNMVPLLGSLHCALGAVDHLHRRNTALVQRLWKAVFRLDIPKRPRPERLHHLFVVVHAAYLIVRDRFLAAASHSDDMQSIYVLFFFEFHLPLALMMYARGS